MLCPKCGRVVSTEILVPLSEVGTGVKSVRCKCGHKITYKERGLDLRLEEEHRKRRIQNTTFLNLTDRQNVFGYAVFALSLVAVAFAAVCSILGGKNDLGMWAQIGSAALLAILSCILAGLFYVLPLVLLLSEVSYTKGANKTSIQRAKVFCCLKRMIGLAIFAGASFAFIRLGLQSIHVI